MDKYTDALFSNITDVPDINCTLENATEEQTEKVVETETAAVCDNTDTEESTANNQEQIKQEHVIQAEAEGTKDRILKYVAKNNKNVIPISKTTGHQKNALKRRKRNIAEAITLHPALAAIPLQFDEPDTYTIVTTPKPVIKEDLKATAPQVFPLFQPLPVLPEGYLERFNITPKQLDFISNMFNKIEVRITDKKMPTQTKTSYDPPIYDNLNVNRHDDEDNYEFTPTDNFENDRLYKDSRRTKNPKPENNEETEKIIHNLSNQKLDKRFEDDLESKEVSRKSEKTHTTFNDEKRTEWERRQKKPFKSNPGNKEISEEYEKKVPQTRYFKLDNEESSDEKLPHNRHNHEYSDNNNGHPSLHIIGSDDESERFNQADRVRKPEETYNKHNQEHSDNDGKLNPEKPHDLGNVRPRDNIRYSEKSHNNYNNNDSHDENTDNSRHTYDRESARGREEFAENDYKNTKKSYNKYNHNGNVDDDEDTPKEEKYRLIHDRESRSHLRDFRPSDDNTNPIIKIQYDDQDQLESPLDGGQDVPKDDKISLDKRYKNQKDNEHETEKPERPRVSHDRDNREYVANLNEFRPRENSRDHDESKQINNDDGDDEHDDDDDDVDDEDDDDDDEKPENPPKIVINAGYSDELIPSDENRGIENSHKKYKQKDDHYDDDIENKEILQPTHERKTSANLNEFRPSDISKNTDKSYDNFNNKFEEKDKQKKTADDVKKDGRSDGFIQNPIKPTNDYKQYEENENYNDKTQRAFTFEPKRNRNSDNSRTRHIPYTSYNERDAQNINDDHDTEIHNQEKEGSLDDIRPAKDSSHPEKSNLNYNRENPRRPYKPAIDSRGMRNAHELILEDHSIDHNSPSITNKEDNSDDEGEGETNSKKPHKKYEPSDDDDNPEKKNPTLNFDESVYERAPKYRKNNKKSHENYNKKYDNYDDEKTEKHIFYPPEMSIDDLKPKSEEKHEKSYKSDTLNIESYNNDSPHKYNLNTSLDSEGSLDDIKPTINSRYRNYKREESSDENAEQPQKQHLSIESYEKLDQSIPTISRSKPISKYIKINDNHEEQLLTDNGQKQRQSLDGNERNPERSQQKYKEDNDNDDSESYKPQRPRYKPASIYEARLDDIEPTEETRRPDRVEIESRQSYRQNENSGDSHVIPQKFYENKLSYNTKPTVLNGRVVQVGDDNAPFDPAIKLLGKLETFKPEEKNNIYDEIAIKSGSVDDYRSDQDGMKPTQSQIYNPGYNLAHISQNDFEPDPIKAKYSPDESEDLNIPRSLRVKYHDDIGDTQVHNFNRKLQSVGSSEEEDIKPEIYEHSSQNNEDDDANQRSLKSTSLENISSENVDEKKGRIPIISYETYHNQGNDNKAKVLDFTPKYKSADITREYVKRAQENRRPEVSYEVYHLEKPKNIVKPKSYDFNLDHRSVETLEKNFNPSNDGKEQKSSKITSYVDKDFAVFDKLHPKTYNKYLPAVHNSNNNTELSDITAKDLGGNVKQQFEKIPLDYMHDKPRKPKGSKPSSYVEKVTGENGELIDNTDKGEDNEDKSEDSEEGTVYDRELETRFNDGKLNLPDIKLPESVLGYYDSPNIENENEDEQQTDEVQKETDNNNNSDDEDTGEKHPPKPDVKNEDYKRTIDTEYDDLYGKFFNDNVDLYESFVRDNFNKKGTFEERSQRVIRDPILKETIKDVLEHTNKNMNNAEKSKNPKYGYMWTMNYGKPL